MYLTFTNASPTHKGNKVAIHKDLILTVHEAMVTRDDETLEMVTFIFGPPHGTWEVSESLEEVVNILNDLA
jgi:hypothetical protein